MIDKVAEVFAAEEFTRLQTLLESQTWIFAKTMPENPHYYTLRRTWADDDFVWAVTMIRRHGYRAKFGGHWYTQLDVGGYFYWTMGWPIGTLDRPGSSTILIYRKPLPVSPSAVVSAKEDATTDR